MATTMLVMDVGDEKFVIMETDLAQKYQQDLCFVTNIDK